MNRMGVGTIHNTAIRLQANFPLREALRVARVETRNTHPRLSEALSSIRYALQHDQSVADTIVRYPDVFDEVASTIIVEGFAANDHMKTFRELAMYWGGTNSLLA